MSDKEDVMGEVDLTSAQMRALASMPVKLAVDGFLPMGAPHASLIKRLEAKGLVRRRHDRWERTALGEAVWGAR